MFVCCLAFVRPNIREQINQAAAFISLLLYFS